MPLIGSMPNLTERYAPGVVRSPASRMAEEFRLDPTLPVLGSDPIFTQDQIVIPAGRLVAIYPDTVSATTKATLTIADGSAYKPVGIAESHMFRFAPNRERKLPTFVRDCLVEVPYVAAVNAAYGALAGGMPLTAYTGATDVTTYVPNHRGKLVKWIEKKVYLKNQTAATTCTLSSAVLPAFRPVIIAAWNAGTIVASGSSVIPTWDTGTDTWIATFANNVTDVLYSYGQGPEMIAGEVVRVEPISSSHELDGWLKWVTGPEFMDWGMAALLEPVPSTAVSAEVPSLISAGVYRLANYPVIPNKPITVTVTGTLINPDGTTTTLNATDMSIAPLPYSDYTRGMYYTIDQVTGYLRFASNVNVTSVTVSYYYESGYRQGVTWAAGIPGLTDGQYSGVPGTPANLEVSGVAGSLRAIIY